MAEQTTAPAINRPATQRSTERREGAMTERVWRSTDYLVRGRFDEAQEALVTKRHDASPARSLELALAMHTADLDEAHTDEWTTTQLTANRVALVVLEMPQTAAAAARQTEGNFTSRQDRINTTATLSRYTQDLAEAMAYMPPSMLTTFASDLRERSNNLLRNEWHLATLTDEHYRRIFTGVTREVAMWRALEAELPEGWEVAGATIEEDRLGTDLIVYDTEDNELRLDVKATGSFTKSLKKNYDEGFITLAEVEEGQRNGFYYSPSTLPNGTQVQICVIDADRLGTIENFEYQDTEPVFTFIEKQFVEQRGKRLRKVGKSAINTQATS
jgi:hypothetical protein